MSQLTLLRKVVTGLVNFPLESPNYRKKHFFQEAMQLLQTHKILQVFT